MEPMKPMKPMQPMEPMRAPEPWWPADMGSPSTTGAQNGLRYAFFGEQHRLIIDRAGTVTVYDTGDHDIGGVAQADGSTRSLEFTSQHGAVRLGELRVVS